MIWFPLLKILVFKYVIRSSPLMTHSSSRPPIQIDTEQFKIEALNVLDSVEGEDLQFQIMYQGEPVARIVSEEFMQAIDELLATDPAFADTLALMLNEEAQEDIKKGQEEAKQGKRISLDFLHSRHKQIVSLRHHF